MDAFIVAKDFFKMGKILKQFNSTYIALIPKCDNVSSLSM